MIRLFASDTLLAEKDGRYFKPASAVSLDAVFTADDPFHLVEQMLAGATEVAAPAANTLRAPLKSQELWAAGVTYLRSKHARMEEAKDGGGGSFYDKVYEAERPELFFKAVPHRVVGPGAKVRIRKDSKWNVPEPELTLAINSKGRIFGFTIGNDMSSRDIEGENPLYLPQAKVYDGSAALGPCLVVTPDLPGAETRISLQIFREDQEVFSDEVDVGRIKRPLPSLAEWLYRECSFPSGSYLMTGTGIVPPDSFTLRSRDEIRIRIEPAGTLINTVE